MQLDNSRRIRLTLWWSVLIAIALSCVSLVSQLQRNESESSYRCWRAFKKGVGKPAIFSGLYEVGEELSLLRLSIKTSVFPCDVWLTGLEPLRMAYGTAAYVTVEGVLSEPGHFGHFGVAERELRVTRVIKVQRIED